MIGFDRKIDGRGQHDNGQRVRHLACSQQLVRVFL